MKGGELKEDEGETEEKAKKGKCEGRDQRKRERRGRRKAEEM